MRVSVSRYRATGAVDLITATSANSRRPRSPRSGRADLALARPGHLQIGYTRRAHRVRNERQLLERTSGAEGSRTLDLLNAIRFPVRHSRPQLTTAYESSWRFLDRPLPPVRHAAARRSRRELGESALSRCADQAARRTLTSASSPAASTRRSTRSIVTFYRLPDRMPVTALRGSPESSASSTCVRWRPLTSRTTAAISCALSTASRPRLCPRTWLPGSWTP